MVNSFHNSASGYGKALKFPGAKAKSPRNWRASSPAPDYLEGAYRLDEVSDTFTPVLDHDESAIVDNSEEFLERLEDEKSMEHSEEEAPVAPEPQLDWAALEQKQSVQEDDLETISSTSIVAEENVPEEVSAETPETSVSDEHDDNNGENDQDDSVVPGSEESVETISPESPEPESKKSASADSRSQERSGESEMRDKSSSSSFPGAVASPSSERPTVESEPDLPPWSKRLPTWKQMVCSSTVTIAVAIAAFVLCLSYFRTGPGEDSSSFGMFSEVLDSVFSQGSSERIFQGKDRLNILCLGIDYNRDEKGMGYTAGARSDTMFVVSINPEGTILNVLSIPRDTQVFISEEYGYDKINSAYSVGGIDKAKEVVSRFLGIPIHKYIIIKVAGAAKMVDAVGGLQIDVEKDMDYDDNWGQLHIHLRAGNQLLQGEQAVGYARFRMDEESDRGRIRRQQQTMQALVQRLKDPMVILRLQAIIKAIKENVITDLSVLDMLDLAYLYKDFDRQRMKTGTLVGDDAEVNGASVIIPYEPENRKIVAELFSDIGNISRSDVNIEVLNGCGDEKMTQQVAEMLTQEGFKVTIGDADRDDYQVTRVIDRLGSIAMRTAVESLVRGCQYETYETASNNRNSDITVIVGQDRQAHQTPAQPIYDTSITIDNGRSQGYVESGNSLSNENTAMPFDDVQVNDTPSYSEPENASVAPRVQSDTSHRVAEPKHPASAEIPEPQPDEVPSEPSNVYEAPVEEAPPAVEVPAAPPVEAPASLEPVPGPVEPEAPAAPEGEVLPDQVTI